MENFPQLEAAYKAMSLENRAQLLHMAIYFAGKYPAQRAGSGPDRSTLTSHLRLIRPGNKL